MAPNGLTQRTGSGLSRGSKASKAVDSANRDEIIEVEKQDPAKVLLHAAEAGDPYYIGDIYQDLPLAIATEWALPTSSEKTPYLLHIKKLSAGWPHLRFLADWMEVGTMPLRWKFQKDQPLVRQERLERTNVARLDFHSDGTVTRSNFRRAEDLEESIRQRRKETTMDGQEPDPQNNTENTGEGAIDEKGGIVEVDEVGQEEPERQKGKPAHDNPVQYRLYVVEDLSCRVIEALGARFDIDPSFFREHILDYAWYNVRDRFMDPPDLDISNQSKDWFQIRWTRARYFTTRDSFKEARIESNRFNILRRPDDDLNNGALLDHKDAVVGLTRTRASFWRSKTGSEEIPVGILLIDPTITEGMPLWRGYRNSEPPPSMADPDPPPSPPSRSSLFEDVIHWTIKPYAWCPNVLPISASEPIIPVQAFLHLVCAEWLIMTSYLSTRLGQLEWEISQPEDFLLEAAADSSLKKLHVWRRLVPLYVEMLKETMDRVFRFAPQVLPSLNASVSSQTTIAPPVAASCPPPFHALKPSFQQALSKMEEAQERLHRLTTIAMGAIDIAEARMSYKENKNISRLSWLATIFIPMTFMTGLFSIQPDIPGLLVSFRYFFAVSIPLAVITVIVAVLAKKSTWMSLKKALHLSKGKADKKKQDFVYYGRSSYRNRRHKGS